MDRFSDKLARSGGGVGDERRRQEEFQNEKIKHSQPAQDFYFLPDLALSHSLSSANDEHEASDTSS